jgi:hypothetical protein
MHRHWLIVRSATARFLILVMMLTILYVLFLDTAVWATPDQSPLQQTVPTLTPTPNPEWLWIGARCVYPIDYAPSGVPDLDQKQNDWYATDNPEIWTHSAPVAALNALWWLDSKLDHGIVPPPTVHDEFRLLTAFGDWDDHDPRNVAPAVEDLAFRMDTNGQRTGASYAGTEVHDVVSALESYLLERELTPTLEVGLYASPSFQQLRGWVVDCDAVILNIGFWQYQGEAWVYLGGHYVTLAGTESLNRFLVIADPWRDAFESGRSPLGRSPVAHAEPHESDVHNDVRYLSHDAFHTMTISGPGGAVALTDYVSFWTAYEDIQNSIGQNVSEDFGRYLGRYSSAEVNPRVDYAIVIAPPAQPVRPIMLPMIMKRTR